MYLELKVQSDKEIFQLLDILNYNYIEDGNICSYIEFFNLLCLYVAPMARTRAERTEMKPELKAFAKKCSL